MISYLHWYCTICLKQEKDYAQLKEKFNELDETINIKEALGRLVYANLQGGRLLQNQYQCIKFLAPTSNLKFADFFLMFGDVILDPDPIWIPMVEKS